MTPSANAWPLMVPSRKIVIPRNITPFSWPHLYPLPSTSTRPKMVFLIPYGLPVRKMLLLSSSKAALNPGFRLDLRVRAGFCLLLADAFLRGSGHYGSLGTLSASCHCWDLFCPHSLTVLKVAFLWYFVLFCFLMFPLIINSQDVHFLNIFCFMGTPPQKK